ncbi:hypothetical protein ACK6D9_04475 [Hoeflea sp. Naph1]|uniref:hypothetical protein n=1 Tax=Hoeflea sp. Naph1 TaxID=3388653 RepID=UPI00398FC511
MIILADTVTKVGNDVHSAVLICGSHGGVYPGYLAAKAGIRGVIFNDAGGGKDNAGIGSFAYLEALGIAAATVSNTSCRIGDATDMVARGCISRANGLARALGVANGEACLMAAEKLEGASLALGHQIEPVREGRNVYSATTKRRIILIDSASLVLPEDKYQIVVTGSHGGLLSGNDHLALQTEAYAGVFHDAGIGIDGAGVTRLPALDRRGIAGIAVNGNSARIGDARSVFEDGIISCVNETAFELGAIVGERVRDRLLTWSAG